MGPVPIKALARELGKSERTLYRWIDAGYGPTAYKIGGAVVYRRDEIDAWFAAQRIAPKDGESVAA